jgi:hypothetical protein
MKPYVPRDAELIYQFAQSGDETTDHRKMGRPYDNSFVKEWDSAGFIDKLFQA